DLTPLAEKHAVSLSHDCECTFIQGSDILINRAIFNLVENAIKYNLPGGSVAVELKKSPSQVEIRVKDSGPGIPERYRDSIFQPFFRIDKSRSRSLGGVGLGLSLVWEIANLHDGSIRVEETSDTGTTILLVLPLDSIGIGKNTQ
ncbi:MAG: sensor histidine kinase, partial [Coriobacteriaceae bacterium]|nr:sensor histidine kinase [Coriobacteriaceae bacterium]